MSKLVGVFPPSLDRTPSAAPSTASRKGCRSSAMTGTTSMSPGGCPARPAPRRRVDRPLDLRGYPGIDGDADVRLAPPLHGKSPPAGARDRFRFPDGRSCWFDCGCSRLPKVSASTPRHRSAKAPADPDVTNGSRVASSAFVAVYTGRPQAETGGGLAKSSTDEERAWKSIEGHLSQPLVGRRPPD